MGMLGSADPSLHARRTAATTPFLNWVIDVADTVGDGYDAGLDSEEGVLLDH